MAFDVCRPRTGSDVGKSHLKSVEEELGLDASPGVWEIYASWFNYHVDSRLPVVLSQMQGGQWR